MKVTADEPGHVPPAVRKYLRAKGLDPDWDWDEVWEEEHGAALAAAEAAGRDVLAGLRDAVARAKADEQPFSEFKRRIRDVLAALGWWGTRSDEGAGGRAETVTPRRLRTVFVTGARVARAVGQWARIQRTADERPFLVYELGPSRVHRPEHEAWAGSILRVDDPLWNKMFPPNGWGCKCRVRQLSQREADNRGGESPPSIEWTTSTDPETGKRVEHPKGIDPEWAYNPGEDARRA